MGRGYRLILMGLDTMLVHAPRARSMTFVDRGD